MNARTIKKLALTGAIAGLIPLGLAAAPAHAATVVTHDGCTLTVNAPIFTNHFNGSGAKLFDYNYRLVCIPSAAGVSVEVKQDRNESDILGRAGDPDAPDEFTGTSTQNPLVYVAAGGTKNITVRAVLPTVNDDTDVPLEMFQVTKFRVTSGAVQGTWSAQAISASRALTR